MVAHSLGNTASEFTSWTSDYDVALKFATKSGATNGVVLTSMFSRTAATPVAANIEAMFQESEFLVKGPMSGASVTPAP